MSKKQKLITLAKEAYNSSDVCQQWKDKILEVCPEFKPTLEVGKWYKRKNYLICIKNIKYNTSFIGSISHRHFGFNNNNWNDNESWYNTDWSNELKPATNKEVEEALIKEAKKRGFKDGVTFRSVIINDKYVFQGEPVFHMNRGFDLYGSNYAGRIFDSKSGVWAQIVSEPVKKMTVAEISKKLGYKIEIVE